MNPDQKTDISQGQTAQNNNERYQALFDQISTGIIVLKPVKDDTDFIIQSMNKKAALMKDIHEDLTGRFFSDLFPCSGEDCIFPFLQQVSKTGDPYHCPAVQCQKTGCWYERIIERLPSGEILLSFIDITALMQTELELQSVNKRYSLALNITHFGVFDWDLKTDRVIWNEAMYDILGRDSAEPHSFDEWLHYIHQDDLEDLKSLNQEILDTKEIRNIEYRIIRPDGVIRIINAIAGPILDKSGEVSHILGVLSDVTERRKIDTEINRISSFVKLNPNPVFEIDHQGVVGYANPATMKMLKKLGLPADPKLLLPHDWKTIFLSIKNEKDESIYREIRVRDRIFGEQIYYAHEFEVLRLYPVDITDLKQARSSLQIANKKLSLLASVTRHDILNKLGIQEGFLSLLIDQISDSRMKEFAIKSKEHTEEIRKQIIFTRTYDQLGVKSPLWQCVDEIIKKLDKRGVTIQGDVGGLELYADQMLEKVFNNLLDNSIIHGEKVTEIWISTRRTSEGLSLFWEDNGIGIPADQKETIFERGVGKHFGFGLFLIREILAITNMTIREIGVEGRGAWFEIMVPPDMFRFTEYLVKPSAPLL